MIELQNLALRAGQWRIDNLSLMIPTGQYAVLMGRTGMGKTTILESICGLRPVERGRILIDGIDVTRWPPANRQIGYVPQDLALFPNMNVRSHLAFALQLRWCSLLEISKRIDELAELLGIGHLLHRSIHHLSGGESQRVALGRALSFRPRVLLLDEPLSALDETTRLQMHDLLRKVKLETRVTALHITHSLEEAVALADRRLLLEKGRIVEASSSLAPNASDQVEANEGRDARHPK